MEIRPTDILLQHRVSNVNAMRSCHRRRVIFGLIPGNERQEGRKVEPRGDKMTETVMRPNRDGDEVKSWEG